MSSTTTPADTYQSNTELYQDPNLVETVDYARRWRRLELVLRGGVPQRARPPRSRPGHPVARRCG